MTTPLQRYEQDLQREEFVEDEAQCRVVEKLDALYHLLVAAERKLAARTSLQRLWDRWRGNRPETIRGLYLWGGVGRGKTYLVDNFHECLPFSRKLRIHFHRFMQRVHAELKQLEGEADPLESIADRLADETRVICFDEFFVSVAGSDRESHDRITQVNGAWDKMMQFRYNSSARLEKTTSR